MLSEALNWETRLSCVFVFAYTFTKALKISTLNQYITLLVQKLSELNPIALLWHSERPKLYGILAVLNAIGLKKQ